MHACLWIERSYILKIAINLYIKKIPIAFSLNLTSDHKTYMEKQREKNDQYTREEEQVGGMILPEILFQMPTLNQAKIKTQWS